MFVVAQHKNRKLKVRGTLYTTQQKGLQFTEILIPEKVL